MRIPPEFEILYSLQEKNKLGERAAVFYTFFLPPANFMLKQLDAQWTQAEWLNFKDEGPVARGAVTHKFRVEDRKRGIVIGYVKWMITMRCYAMHPLNFPLSPKALQDLVDFCEHTTAAHRQRTNK